jgi:putative phosphoesterase
VKVGIISDTHGLLRPEVFDIFAGVDHILHAGDIGEIGLLDELEAIAPVTAVFGNTDPEDVRDRVPRVARIELGGVDVVVVHGDEFGRPAPRDLAEGYPDADLIIFGHTHQPVIERVGSNLVVNPGSAGPRRFTLPVTAALATIADGNVEVELIPLSV